MSHVPPLDEIPVAFEMLDRRSRLEFLTKLSERFCPTDRWHLQQLLYAQNSYFDIVTNLPTEIATQVLSYLEPRKIIPYRRVGSRWHDLLTADSVCSALLRKWYPKEAKMRQQNQWSWRRMFENAVSREWAVHRPHLCERIPIPMASIVSERLVVLATDCRSFEIRQLLQGHQIAGGLAVPARTMLAWVRLLDDYVMASGEDTAQVWVWHIETLESHMFRLPNAGHAVATDGNLVAFAWRGGMSVYDAATRDMVRLGDPNTWDGVYIDSLIQKVSIFDNNVPSMKTYSTVTGELLSEISEWLKPVDQGTIRFNPGSCAEHLYALDHLWGHPHQWAGTGSSEDGVYSNTTVFDSRTCRIMYQRLWFKGLRELPEIVRMFDGTIHALLQDRSGIAIATHVPMVTSDDGNGGAFFEVNFTIVHSEEWGLVDPTASLFPLFIMPPDNAVFMSSFSPSSWVMLVYKGIHELEEEKEGAEEE